MIAAEFRNTTFVAIEGDVPLKCVWRHRKLTTKTKGFPGIEMSVFHQDRCDVNAMNASPRSSSSRNVAVIVTRRTRRPSSSGCRTRKDLGLGDASQRHDGQVLSPGAMLDAQFDNNARSPSNERANLTC